MNIVSIIGVIITFASLFYAYRIYKKQKHESTIANHKIESAVYSILTTLAKIERLKTKNKCDEIEAEIELLNIKLKGAIDNIEKEKLNRQKEKNVNQIMRLKNQSRSIENEIVGTMMQEIEAKLNYFTEKKK